MAKKKGVNNIHHLKVVILATVAFIVLVFTLQQASSVLKSSECANSISCVDDLGKGDYTPENNGVFLGKAVAVPQEKTSALAPANVLGENSIGKHIYIDLTHQRLYAKVGDSVIYDFPVSTGKWGQTPTGNFTFWYKIKYTRMTGGNKALGTYYNLPNVPFTMFFYNDQIPKSRGYAIHGAYWHDNFGYPMSHGCINLSPDNAQVLYYWADPAPAGNIMQIGKDVSSTPITIYGKFEGA